MSANTLRDFLLLEKQIDALVERQKMIVASYIDRHRDYFKTANVVISDAEPRLPVLMLQIPLPEDLEEQDIFYHVSGNFYRCGGYVDTGMPGCPQIVHLVAGIRLRNLLQGANFVKTITGLQVCR